MYWGGAGLACVAAMVAISLLIISPAYAELFNSAARAKHGADLQQMGGMSAWLGRRANLEPKFVEEKTKEVKL